MGRLGLLPPDGISVCQMKYNKIKIPYLPERPPHPPPPRFPAQNWECGDLYRCRLPPVINHSTLAYVCHYPGSIYPVWHTKFISRQLTPSYHTTGSTEPFWCLPLWPYVGQVLSWGYIRVHQLRLHQGAQPHQEGFPRLWDPIPPPPPGYLSSICDRWAEKWRLLSGT